MTVMVIANNFLSDTTNNGKTLKYLLSDYSQKDLIWLYTTPLSTDISSSARRILLTMFGRIVDLEGSVTPCSSQAGGNIQSVSGLASRLSFYRDLASRGSLVFTILQLLRECFIRFSAKRIEIEIHKKLKEEHVEKIIFVGGDFIFLHLLALRLSRSLDATLHTLVTDDYLFDYKADGQYSLRSGLHARFLRIAFVKTLAESRKIHFISTKMKEIYRENFSVDGCLSFNSCSSRVAEHFEENLSTRGQSVLLVRYFGSLHSGRADALKSFMLIVDQFNSTSEKKLVVEVYSALTDNRDFTNSLACGSLRFREPLAGRDFESALANAGALLILESGQLAHLKCTWLSFSTKVMEYLASLRPIIAFGPLDNPSIGELVSNKAALHAMTSIDFNCLFDDKVIENLILSSAAFYRELDESNTLF